MIIIFGITFLALIVGLLIWLLCNDEDGRLMGYVTTFVFWMIVMMIFVIVPIACSYNSYLNQRAFYDAVVNQYRDSVFMYKDHAVIDVESASLSDFKYQGYQENIASMIKDLRKGITEYNLGIIKKRKMNANPLFSWIIIAPDSDMKLLEMRKGENKE